MNIYDALGRYGSDGSSMAGMLECSVPETVRACNGFELGGTFWYDSIMRQSKPHAKTLQGIRNARMSAVMRSMAKVPYTVANAITIIDWSLDWGMLIADMVLLEPDRNIGMFHGFFGCALKELYSPRNPTFPFAENGNTVFHDAVDFVRKTGAGNPSAMLAGISRLSEIAWQGVECLPNAEYVALNDYIAQN